MDPAIFKDNLGSTIYFSYDDAGTYTVTSVNIGMHPSSGSVIIYAVDGTTQIGTFAY